MPAPGNWHVNTPSETQLAVAQADTAATQARVLKETAPAIISQANTTAKTQELALADQLKLRTLQDAMWADMQKAQQPQSQLAAGSAPQQSVQQQSTPLFDPRIEQVMDATDPNDPNAAEKWDNQMSALAKDVPQAQQFVGKFSKGSLNNWRSQIGAHAVSSPLANASALGQFATAQPQSQLAPAAQPQTPQQARASIAAISPLTGKYDPSLAEMAIRFPEKAREYQAMEGMMVYQQTGNVEALKRWAPELYQKLASAEASMSEAQQKQIATRAGFMASNANAVIVLGNQVKQAGGNPDTDPKVRAAYNTAVIEAAKQGFIPLEDAKSRLSKPIDWAELSALGVRGQTITQYLEQSPEHKGAMAGAEAAAKAPYDTHYTQAGINDEGNLQVMDTKTGQVRDTGVRTVNKQQQYWQFKHDAAVAAGYPEGEAIAIANGNKIMTSEEMARAAQANTVKQQANAQMMGQPFDYNQAYQQNLQMLQATHPAPPTPAGAAPAGAPDRPRTRSGFTVEQANAAHAFVTSSGHYDAKARPGAMANPVAPKNEREIARLAKGTYYFSPDGKLRQKR